MRRFGTQGPVHPEKNYVVSRADELTDFVSRVKEMSPHTTASPLHLHITFARFI